MHQFCVRDADGEFTLTINADSLTEAKRAILALCETNGWQAILVKAGWLSPEDLRAD